MIYLATPIAHTDPIIESWRVSVATRAAASLHDAGIPVFSPATHGHGFAKIAGTRQRWDYWSRVDLPILRHCCDVLVVLDLYGWHNSQGVRAEIEEAESGPYPVPIVHIQWCTCGMTLNCHSPGTDCPCEPLIPFSEIMHHLTAV